MSIKIRQVVPVAKDTPLNVFIADLNRILADIARELSTLRGEAGTVSITSPLDLNGNRITNVGRSTSDHDVVTRKELKERSLYAAGIGDVFQATRPIEALQGVRVPIAISDDESVPLGQFREFVAGAAAVSAPPEVEDAGALGTVTTRFALEDHTHRGLNLADAQTVTGLKTFDRDPSPPFAVSASSASVTNLDADLVDGFQASAFVRHVDRDVTAVTISNDATEQTVYTVTVAGGTLGTTGRLVVVAMGEVLNATGVNRTFTFNLKYGGATIATVTTGNIATNATARGWVFAAEIGALNSANAQVASAQLVLNEAGVSGTSVLQDLRRHSYNDAVAVASGSDQTLALSVQLSTASVSLTHTTHTVHVTVHP